MTDPLPNYDNWKCSPDDEPRGGYWDEWGCWWADGEEQDETEDDT